jgi:hypothetical protein
VQANVDKKFFVEQHKAAGSFLQCFQDIYEAAFPGLSDTL